MPFKEEVYVSLGSIKDKDKDITVDMVYHKLYTYHKYYVDGVEVSREAYEQVKADNY